MKNLAIIPARSGSKGIKDKNIKLFKGKPLLAYSIEAALKAHVFDEIMVSTDNENYAQIAKKFGASVPFLRSKENASDAASTWDMVAEILEEYAKRNCFFDTFTLLQPTSPLREALDIVEVYNKMNVRNAGAIVSVCEMEHSPALINMLPSDESMEGFIDKTNNARRQELRKYYRINGAIYTVKTDFFAENHFIYRKGCFAYVMDTERSVDIDTNIDFILAEAIMDIRNA